MKSFAVLALLAAAVAVASLRLWDCPLCGRPPAPVNCPACRDAGRVSGFTRAIRPPSLRPLLEAHPGRPVRFARLDEEDVVVLLLESGPRAEALLVDLGGARLDRLEATPLERGGRAWMTFIDAGEFLLIAGVTNPWEAGFLLGGEGRTPELVLPGGELYGFSRFGLARRRFERVPP